MNDEKVDAPAAAGEPAEDKTTAIVSPGQEEEAPNAEDVTEAEAHQAAVEEATGDEPKRPSRSQRQSRKLALLAAENADLRRMLEEPGRRPR